jgi:crossover junction endodeoxyribonuclease RuvC
VVIIGIDPGFAVTGYGVLRQDGSRFFLIDYGFLKMSPKHTLVQRVGTFHAFFNEKITTYSATDIALETPFLGKNAQNFLKLGYLRGLMYLLANTHQLTLHECAPTEVKQAVTGFGGADKQQVARVIMRLFPVMAVPEKADVTDALAVTLCALWKAQCGLKQKT